MQTTPRIFTLMPRGPLEPRPLSSDMRAALSDAGVVRHAAGVLSVVCDWMDLYHTHYFVLYANEAKSYDLDLTSSMLTCLEQLPGLADWIAATRTADYFIDMNAQGVDMQIELTKASDGIRHVCIEDRWGVAPRIRGDVLYSSDSLRSMCSTLAQEVARAAAAMNTAIHKVPVFREWCSKCGYELCVE